MLLNATKNILFYKNTCVCMCDILLLNQGIGFDLGRLIFRF